MHFALDFFAKLSKILQRDRRYHEEVYFFIMTALDRVMRRLEARRHITGQELLKGVREEAKDQFGPMAQTVFAHWGIKNSLDFGILVFNMVEAGILSKTETDSIEDFRDARFFENLFDSDSAYRLRPEKALLVNKK